MYFYISLKKLKLLNSESEFSPISNIKVKDWTEKLHIFKEKLFIKKLSFAN